MTPRHSAWQAWHLVIFTFVSRGRRGTNSHLLSFCVAGVAQTQLYRRFAWQAWDRWHWVACLVWFGRALVARDAAAFCVAGVAQTYSYCRFAWQAWHKLASTVVLRGRRGTNSHLPSFGTNASTVVLRGRRGTNSHLPSFCVAGVGQMALGGVLGVSNSSCVLRPVLVSNCKCGCRPVSPACFGIKLSLRLPAWPQEGRQDCVRLCPQEGRQDCVRLCLFWHVCYLTCLIAFFLWLVSFPDICGQVVVFVLYATTGRAQLRLEQHFHSPHLCVGFLFLILYPGLLRHAFSSRRLPNLTYNKFTYTNLTYK